MASNLSANNTSNVTMNGGTVVGDLFAYDSAIITISGIDFMVDGVPVLYGNLSALTGTLTGTLARGGSLNTVFYQGGYPGVAGTITLAPETAIPVPSLSPEGLAMLGGLIFVIGIAEVAATRRRRTN